VLLFDRREDRAAVIQADGTIQLPDGRRGSIHAIGALVAGLPSCNGWDHWYYAEGDQLLPIDRLRERVRAEQ
jgi:modification methylase